LAARAWRCNSTDGLDEHVPLVDELEHVQHPQPGDLSSDTADEQEAEDVA
jgi:hypothetical protein